MNRSRPSRASTFQADIGSDRILYVPEPPVAHRPLSEAEYIERYIKPAIELIRSNPTLARKLGAPIR